jgi:hypothetical protein
VHSARVLGLGAAEEQGRPAATLLTEVGDLKGVQVGILGVGDLGLPTEVEPDHGDAVGRIGVCGDGQPAGFVDETVGDQDIARRPYRRDPGRACRSGR